MLPNILWVCWIPAPMSSQLAVTGLIWKHTSATIEKALPLFSMRAKCRSQAELFSELDVIQIYLSLEKRDVVSGVRTGGLFLQKIACSNWNWGRVPALIFDLGMYLSVRENSISGLCLKSCLRSITWRDRSHTLLCWWSLLADHQQSVAVSKFVQRSKSI